MLLLKTPQVSGKRFFGRRSLSHIPGEKAAQGAATALATIKTQLLALVSQTPNGLFFSHLPKVVARPAIVFLLSTIVGGYPAIVFSLSAIVLGLS